MSRIVGGRLVHVYERVRLDEWLPGEIEAVQYDPKRLQSIKDKDTGEWRKEPVESLRFKFRLEGYQFPHYSRWMRASTNEKSNLYSKYLKHLCPKYDCLDKMIDLDKLIGVKVKIMWEADGEYDNVVQIRGLDPALNILAEEQSNVGSQGPDLEPLEAPDVESSEPDLEPLETPDEEPPY